MKKQMSLFIWAVAAFGMAMVITAPVFAETERGGHGATGGRFRGASTIDTSGPGVRVQNNINIFKHDTQPTTPAYTVEQGRPMFYVTPERRGELYNDFRTCTADDCDEKPVPFVRSDSVRAQGEKKMHITHPFFQPAQGRFGAVTDIGHARNSFNFAIPVLDPNIDTSMPDTWTPGESGKWEAGQTFIKQDVSYGITDSIALLANIKYGFNNTKFTWDLGHPTDKASGNELDQAGIGIVWRFYDDADYIAHVAAMYQWTSSANALALSGKFGRKMGNSTLYGLARVWGINWNENAYGAYIHNEDDNNAFFIVYNKNSDMVLNLEAGAGIYSALDDSWSVNAELVLGDYDWHQQAGIFAALNWQPTQTFAVGIYGRMSLWDTAKNQNNIEMYASSPYTNSVLVPVGRANLSNYSDLSFGARMFLYF